MSDAQIEAEAPAAATEGAPASADAAPKPAKARQFLDYDALEVPPEVKEHLKERHNHLYRIAKDNERVAGAAMSRVIELDKQIAALNAKLAAAESAATERNIKARLADAQARGAYDEAAEMQAKLAEVAAAKVAPKVAPQPQVQGPTEGALTPYQMEVVNEWANELDDDTGNFLRPWATAGHPKQREAIDTLSELWSQPEWREKGLKAVLKEADRRMSPNRAPRQSAAALGNGDSRPAATKGLGLTPEELFVAKKMGIDPKAYAKAKAGK